MTRASRCSATPTSHYLAEALRDIRKHAFTEVIDRHSMGAHLNAHDGKFVRQTVSGLMKILWRHELPGNIKPLLAHGALPGREGQRRQASPHARRDKRSFLDVSPDIMELLDPIFFGDPKTAAMKALGR